MSDRTAISPEDFFSNPAARKAGFTEQFWHHAYTLYLEASNRDPSPSLDKFDLPRTLRMPFNQGDVDVLVRVHPDSREFRSIRFTVFPAGNEPEVAQVSRWYFHGGETRPVLGEGSLLNEGNRWQSGGRPTCPYLFGWVQFIVSKSSETFSPPTELRPAEFPAILRTKVPRRRLMTTESWPIRRPAGGAN